MARTTLSARMTALENSVATLVSALTAAQAAKAAPAQAKAESPFVVSMRERAQARVGCTVHTGCTRRFSPKSSGATSHVACAGKCPDGARHHH